MNSFITSVVDEIIKHQDDKIKLNNLSTFILKTAHNNELLSEIFGIQKDITSEKNNSGIRT